MPSVFTIQGPDITLLGRSRRSKKSRRKARRGFHGPDDNCKCIYNPKTERYSELCYVGKASSPTGWKFTKGGAKRCGR